MAKRVCIIGAGVSGLCLAHELSKYPEKFEVVMYERNPEVGGQARSALVARSALNARSDTPDGVFSEGNIHSEYCWHVVSNRYDNLWKILKEIPTPEGVASDNLKPIEKYIYSRYNNTIVDDKDFFMYSINPLRYLKMFYTMDKIKELTLFDLYKIFQIKLLAYTSCDKRLEEWDDVLYTEFTKDLSDEARKFIGDSPSIYLGMNMETLSTHTILKLFKPMMADGKCKADGKNRSHDGKNPQADFYCFNGSINEKWFEPWVKYLESRGVKIHLNTPVDKVVIDPSTNVARGVYVSGVFIPFDYIVNSCGVECLEKLFSTDRFNELAKKGYQIQTQVLYFINKKLDLPPTLIILPDTPYQIMIRPEGGLWDSRDLSSKTPNDTFDILSAGIGLWHTKGINGKTAKECSIEELIKEVWGQISQSEVLFEYIKTCDGMKFKDATVVGANVWPSYTFSEKEKEITTWEPKFSNGIGCLKLRPNTSDPIIKNLIHSTAYVNTDTGIFNMESGAEAGVRACKEILKRETAESGQVSIPQRYSTNIFQKCDETLHTCYLPQVVISGTFFLLGCLYYTI